MSANSAGMIHPSGTGSDYNENQFLVLHLFLFRYIATSVVVVFINIVCVWV